MVDAVSRITSDCALMGVPCTGYSLLYIPIMYSVAAWPMLDMSKLFRRPRLSAAKRRKASEEAIFTLGGTVVRRKRRKQEREGWMDDSQRRRPR